MLEQYNYNKMMNIRVGFGFDVHPLGEGRELWLGGIKFEFDKGCVGHSDADVLLHAICDALLGAANLRDIGFHIVQFFHLFHPTEHNHVSC